MNNRSTLTTGDVAKYCDVNFRTVIRWIDRGWLKAYKLPGRGDHRVPIESLRNFLSENNIPIPEEININRHHVLIVDDEKPMALAIARILKRNGYEVEIANDGFTAGNKMQLFKPAVITLDLKMPGMHGFDVLKYIKTERNIVPTSVLVISAEPEDQLQKALNHGADDVLSKPFKSEQLVHKISTLINIS